MPTANRRRFVPTAIRMFLAQDYPKRELVIVDDGADSVADLIPAHPQIRYLRLTGVQPLGAKRNLACEAASGEIILHWDDDDWYAPSRVRYQVEELLADRADICGIDRVLFVDARSHECWEYSYPRSGAKPWAHGATLCYRKAFWRGNPFPEINVGEDTCFMFNARGIRLRLLDDNRFYVGLIHPANTSPKKTGDVRWATRPLDQVRAIMGADLQPLLDGAVQAATVARPKPTALIAAASGIGDIVRVTPLIRVVHRLGYRVDVLLAPDYSEAADLLRGAPEIERLIPYDRGAPNPDDVLSSRIYDLACFTVWSAKLSCLVKATTRHAFVQADWLRLGDHAAVVRIANALGWRAALPEAFVRTSGRRFELPRGTVTLHPGCKPDWPWKKWHGFDELAALFPNVAIVGTASDLDNSGTYFNRSFAWPSRARTFVGDLSLADTAALIAQSAALVSNDSGLMHVGAALGVPTFGVFGITSPERECTPSRYMIAVTKKLPCEPACRRQSWGRRDCEHHLACLKTLSPEEVHAQVSGRLSLESVPVPAVASAEKAAEIGLNYYAGVFDASGYGEAARAYVHALHAAGVRICVVDTGSKPAQVNDPLVASLVGHDPSADFNLFHGIPALWARSAYRMRNVIAMTVWETDRMPQLWRGPLSHAIDVWLPCTFNVEVFSRDLGRNAFCLPHALPSRSPERTEFDAADWKRFGIRPDDYVFYSIFEWQDRKNPSGLIEAFLQAFPDDSDAVLLVKTSSAAAGEAQRTLETKRAATHSRARIVLCCQALSASVLQALQVRGDCYVSLHRGEGWGYPLFEAACAGKPIIATNYAGPLDYLDAQRHWLVRQRSAPVRQQYIFYHPSMNWAEPDLAHAAEGMRWTHDYRALARSAAEEAARPLRRAYSLDHVGNVAKARLAELLKRTQPHRYIATATAQRSKKAPATLPIPGDWYDADYYEYGNTSNWTSGYSWPIFKSLFESAAAFLTEMFPGARTFLDAGCAKGFLVKALRARGIDALGFDHSAWAIAAVDPTLGAFVQLNSTDTAAYEDRRFDVTVAMSLLESLTEEQLRIFLPRARKWTREALVATILTTDARTAQEAASDRDLSHITLRDRAWWRELFIETGWRQDALHRRFERLCQAHALPTKMGWNLFVFSPG